MSSPWTHRTKTGRVVYARKPRFLQPKDIERIYRGWLTPEAQSSSEQVNEVMWNLWVMSMEELTRRQWQTWMQGARRWLRELWKRLISMGYSEEQISELAVELGVESTTKPA